MDDLVVWEQICIRLDILDIVSLFQLSRLHRNLADRTQIWPILMKRDFPEHYSYFKPDSCAMVYKDLYQYGAYFGIRRAINVYPEKILYTTFVYTYDHHLALHDEEVRNVPLDQRRVDWRTAREEHEGFRVLTSRVKTGFRRSWLRWPGQIHVWLLARKKIGKNVWDQLSKQSSKAVALFSEGQTIRLFVRLNKPIPSFDSVEISPLVKYDGSKLKPLSDWIQRYFFVYNIDWEDGYLMFYAKLLPDLEIDYIGPQGQTDPMATVNNRQMTQQMWKYQLYPTIPGQPFQVDCLLWTPLMSPKVRINRINGQELIVPKE